MTVEPIEGKDKQGLRIVITSDGSAIGAAIIEILRKAIRDQGGDEIGDLVR